MCEENMRALYEASWGWDAKSKKAELSHVAARYVAAVDASGELVGYVHFRFAWDDDGERLVVLCFARLCSCLTNLPPKITTMQTTQRKWWATFTSCKSCRAGKAEAWARSWSST